MNRNKVLAITTLFVLSLVVFAGAALAQGPDTNNPNDGWIGQMQRWMGPEAWGEMIQHMTQTHGPEFTTEMLQKMGETGDCHEDGDFEDMMNGGHTGSDMNNGMMSGGHMGSDMGGGMMSDAYGTMMNSTF